MKIGIVGQGYVGLPLACLFATKYKVVGFDISEEKIKLLNNGIDYTDEVGSDALKNSNLTFTSNGNDLKDCEVLIVAVPTDIDENNVPDLKPLQGASTTIGKILQKGMTVVYESTVYPGLTEEVCIPILEEVSGLKWKQDFFVGYSPERINPGDKQRPLHKILKIVSGDTPETLKQLSALYGSVIEAGIYEAPSLKVAEAAKVIENAQRDLNIAFMNELAVIFDRVGIDTRDVIKAAATKWNFLAYEPGLVGGHCIGVDPYYLAFKAEQLGYTPQVIHSGRSLNNQMGKFIAEKVLKTLIDQQKNIAKTNVLLLGCAFKENVPDTRNSKVFDIVNALKEYQINVHIVDPVVAAHKKNVSYKFSVDEKPSTDIKYDAVILAVKHHDFLEFSVDHLKSISTNSQLNLFDVKGFFNREQAIANAEVYWRL
ncbi:MAG: nucleotide sugar dehydrogenase [Chitinophagaceae bacterium]